MTPQDEDPHILVKSDRVYGRGQVGYQVLAQRILGKENHFHKDKKGKVPVQILGKMQRIGENAQEKQLGL